WRGPIWMPVNFLILHALREYYLYYGDTFKIECPTGSGNLKNLAQVAEELARRLTRSFLGDAKDETGVCGDYELLHPYAHRLECIPFHEYCHGETGRGCGASHQTGWTGVIAQILIGLGEASTTANH